MKVFKIKKLWSSWSVLALAGLAMGAATACSSAGGSASAPMSWSPAKTGEVQVLSQKTVGGFVFPESVAYDPNAKVLYVGEFGGDKLQPAEKDGKGYIIKVDLNGKIIDPHFLPAPGVTMNKPKGIWLSGNHLWVTDIDGVWEFDTTTKQGRKLDLPGAEFANDPAILGNTLYVSDNRTDTLFSVTPADFLGASNPKVEKVWSKLDINPNGLYPSKDGSLLMVGFEGPSTGKNAHPNPRAIYSMVPGQNPKPLSDAFGMLDGLYEMGDGTILFTNWDTGSVNIWTWQTGLTEISKGLKGPADLTAFPYEGGLMVVVPDLVYSELRFIQLGN